jgi:hypothetical protein
MAVLLGEDSNAKKVSQTLLHRATSSSSEMNGRWARRFPSLESADEEALPAFVQDSCELPLQLHAMNNTIKI